MMWRRKAWWRASGLALSLLTLGAGLASAWSAGTAPGTSKRNDHGALAVRAAVACMRDKNKLVPPGCGAKNVVGIPYLFDQLIRGAQEPDLLSPLGDGTGSSKHSLNPRYSASMKPPIIEAYSEFSDSSPISAGKAEDAITEERTAISASLLILDRNCADPKVEQSNGHETL